MADSSPANQADTQTAAPQAATSAQLAIEKIYVKDLSLENPGAPQSFQMSDAPQIEIGLRTRGEQIAPDVYECVLTLTVTARASDKTASSDSAAAFCGASLSAAAMSAWAPSSRAVARRAAARNA